MGLLCEGEKNPFTLALTNVSTIIPITISNLFIKPGPGRDDSQEDKCRILDTDSSTLAIDIIKFFFLTMEFDQSAWPLKCVGPTSIGVECATLLCVMAKDATANDHHLWEHPLERHRNTFWEEELKPLGLRDRSQDTHTELEPSREPRHPSDSHPCCAVEHTVCCSI